MSDRKMEGRDRAEEWGRGSEERFPMAKETAKGWEEGVHLTSPDAHPELPLGGSTPRAQSAHLGRPAFQCGHRFSPGPLGPHLRHRASPHSRVQPLCRLTGPKPSSIRHKYRPEGPRPRPGPAGVEDREPSEKQRGCECAGDRAAAAPGGSPRLQLSTVTPHLPDNIRETAVPLSFEMRGLLASFLEEKRRYWWNRPPAREETSRFILEALTPSLCRAGGAGDQEVLAVRGAGDVPREGGALSKWQLSSRGQAAWRGRGCRGRRLGGAGVAAVNHPTGLLCWTLPEELENTCESGLLPLAPGSFIS